MATLQEVYDLMLAARKYENCLFALSDTLLELGYSELGMIVQETNTRIERSENDRCLDCGTDARSVVTLDPITNNTVWIYCPKCKDWNHRVKMWKKGGRRKRYTQRLIPKLAEKLWYKTHEGRFHELYRGTYRYQTENKMGWTKPSNCSI